MLEQKLLASEHVQRYNDNVRSQDMTSRMLKLETSVGGFCVVVLWLRSKKQKHEDRSKVLGPLRMA